MKWADVVLYVQYKTTSQYFLHIKCVMQQSHAKIFRQTKIVNSKKIMPFLMLNNPQPTLGNV